MVDLLKLYQLAFGEMSPEEIEWCGTRQGQGFGPHGSGNDGASYVACPVCGGLRERNGEFVTSAVGHRMGCSIAAALGRPVPLVLTPGDEYEEEEEEEL